MKRAVVLLGLAIVSLATPALAQDKSDELASKARTVLHKYCARCHNGSGSEGGNFDVLKHADLLDPNIAVAQLVVPKDVKNSLVWKRITSTKSPMPPKKVTERPSDEDRKILEKWIEAGAPDYTPGPRRVVSLKDNLAAMRAHLLAAKEADRPHLRFFTLTHLHNDPGIRPADLRLYRAAVSKAVNSLSWMPGVVLPRPIDRDRTVLAIDLRELGWDRGRWRALLAFYPYGLRHDEGADAELVELDRALFRESRGVLPYVRGDWFVAEATTPPLYRDLLGLPKEAGELERRLGVDVRANFLSDRVVRAGFRRSGVAGANRLVERHQAEGGGYWKTYDFAAGRGGRHRLLEFPLGPRFEGNPHDDLAFDHAGSEALFALPNGLPAYSLSSARGELIDQQPIDLVSDPLTTSGSPVVVLGLSCIGCHRRGLIPAADDVREGTSVTGKGLEKVLRLHPGKGAFVKVFDADQAAFRAALERATGPFLRVDEDAGKAIDDFDEPIRELTEARHSAALELADVARELGLADVVRLEQTLIVSESRLARRLAPLRNGKPITRSDWQEREGSASLFQRAAGEFDAGVPWRLIR